MPDEPKTANDSTIGRTLFANLDYRRIWIIGGLAGIARWLEFVVLGIFAYDLTNSASFVGLVAVLRMAPFAILGPVVGALGDIFAPQRLLLASLLIALAVAGAMALLAAFDLIGPRLVMIAALLSGVSWVTDMPFRRRSMIDAVGESHASAAMGFDNSTNSATRAVGPLLGGFVYQWLEIDGIFLLNALLYLNASLLAARLISAQVNLPRLRSNWRLQLFLPPREVILNGRFWTLVGVTLVFNLFCFPILAMIPVIGSNHLQLSAPSIGALSALEGCGATVGAIMVGIWATHKRLFWYHFGGTLVFEICLFMLSLTLNIPIVALLLLLIGIAGAGFSATQYALVHTIVPPQFRGRATGFLSLFIGSGVVGFYLTGQLFEHFPIQDALRIMAASGFGLLFLLGVIQRHAVSNSVTP